MSVMRPIITITLAAALYAGQAVTAAPLFETDETLALTIEAPMRELIRYRKQKNEYDATVTWTDEAGTAISIPAKLKPRGNHRLTTCDFPPLRIEFDPSDTAGTIFDGQQRLKMVNPCGNGSDQKAWLAQEYGVYRGYNVITDRSFRVRHVAATYKDSSSRRWEREYPAFFIESIDGVAERTGLKPIRPARVRYDQFDIPETTNHLLYQFLISNTDFSMLKGPTGEGCCHNARILSPPGREHEWVVLPYDFDQAGLVDTDYALPDKRLGLRSVQVRLYRGFCWQNHALEDAIAHYNNQRDELTAALISDDLSRTRKRRVQRLVDGFYQTINDDEELQRRIMDKCRGPDTFEIRASTTAGE